jgi:hypothetical protein
VEDFVNGAVRASPAQDVRGRDRIGPVEDVGKVAEAAGVKTLALSHFVPPDDPNMTDQMWIDGARGVYKGHIIVGKGLLEISLRFAAEFQS